MTSEDHGEGTVGPRPETAAGGPVPSPPNKHDFTCLQRRALFPYLCTCGLTDAELNATVEWQPPTEGTHG